MSTLLDLSFPLGKMREKNLDRGGNLMQTPEYQNASWLREKYLEEGMSLAAIAKLCRVSPETIRRWMQKYKIRLRTRTQARILRQRRLRLARNEELIRSVLEEEEKRRHAVERHKNIGRRRENWLIASRSKPKTTADLGLECTAEDQMEAILDQFERK
jgi:hypothetical protein